MKSSSKTQGYNFNNLIEQCSVACDRYPSKCNVAAHSAPDVAINFEAVLHAWLLTPRPQVVPEVEEGTCDIITSKAIEGDLGCTCLEGDSKHDRDDESAIGGNG